MIDLTVLLTLGQTAAACVAVADQSTLDSPNVVHLVSGDHWYLRTSPEYLLHEHAAEGFVRYDVDEEVNGGVECYEHIDDGLEINQSTAAITRLVRKHFIQHIPNKRRHLAGDEGDDDNYESESHIAIIRLTATLHLQLHTTMRLHRFDQANGYHSESDYRQHQQEYKKKCCVVNAVE